MSTDSQRLQVQRRTFLQAGAIAGFGLDLPGLLWNRRLQAGGTVEGGQAAERGRGKAKSCILLYMTGGPGQHETFDPKPDARPEYRGDFKNIPTSVPGVELAEHLPMMARNAHRYCILRSVHHDSNTHGVGVHYNLTGWKARPTTGGEPQASRRDPPCVGGTIRQLRGDKNGLPASVQLPVPIGDENNYMWGGQHAGFLGQKYDPLMLIDDSWNPGVLPPDFSPSEKIGLEGLKRRRELLQKLIAAPPDRRSEPTEVYARFRDQAFDILRSGSAWDAFSIEDEKPGMLERYGDNKFGRSCMVARRLIDAGVGLVTVPYFELDSHYSFDTHWVHCKMMKERLLPPVDRAFSALLEDLADRGLLDETLVVWTGEFGRSPKINRDAGRDHWSRCYTTVLAGGGVRGGQVYGASDKDGGTPVDNPVHVSDFVATIYHALGYSRDTLVHDVLGRPHPIVRGEAVTEIF